MQTRKKKQAGNQDEKLDTAVAVPASKQPMTELVGAVSEFDPDVVMTRDQGSPAAEARRTPFRVSSFWVKGAELTPPSDAFATKRKGW